ncbi:MAG: hypothetical protein EAZ08_00655 [Cytophagales bacterium]|nr:MAG: hypothetical protein EAZ08_00655 [Cytophagales bacterium]
MRSFIIAVLILFFAQGVSAQTSRSYGVISVDDAEPVYYNGKALKVKDIIPAGAKLSFSSRAAKVVVYSPKEGKFILSIQKQHTSDREENLTTTVEQALVSPMDFYFQSTRGDAGSVNLEDFASVLQDNPAESDLITVYFMNKEPFVVNVPKILLDKGAYFALSNKANQFKLEVKDGKLIFEPNIKDEQGQLLAVQTLPQLDFYYYVSGAKPYLLGRMKFESF